MSSAPPGYTLSRAFRWFERTVLGAGMTVAAFVIERQLLKAIKKGSVEAAPRTAESQDARAPETRHGPVEIARPARG